MLLWELEGLNTCDENKAIRSDVLQQYLIFMFTTWDADSAEIKSVIAHYSTGNRIRAEFLCKRYVILYHRYTYMDSL